MKKAFNPEELQKEVERLKSEGRMPSMKQFLSALSSPKTQDEQKQKIKKNKNKPMEERTTHRKKENHRIPRPDKE